MTGGQGRWHGRDVTVLHVDDDPAFLEMVGTFLEREDDRLDVETAESAAEGVERLAEGGVDCVVSDYDIPERNGIAFLERVREDHPDLPFILFTGKGSEEVASDAISAGVTDYMQKETGTDQYAVLANRVVNAVEQHRAERKAERHRRRLTELSESTDDCLWMFDSDWEEFLFISGYEEVWGRPESAIRDDPREFLEGVHPEDRDHVRDAMERLSAGKPIDIEYRIVRGDGEVGAVWAKGDPIFDDAGNVVRVVGFTRDVTGRKEQTRRLETLISNLPGIVYRSRNDPDWPMEVVRGNCEALTGYSREALESGDVVWGSDVLHPDDRDEIWETVQTALAEDRPFEVTYRVRTRDGATRWMWERGRAVPSEDDAEILEGFITDVTERRERERQLRRTERRYQAVFDDPNILVGLLDTDGTVLDVNPTAMAYVDATAAEVTGKPFAETPWFERSRALQRDVEEWVDRAADGEYVDFEADLVRPNGEPYAVEGVFRPVTNEDDEVVSLLVSSRDVTERKARERELERYEAYLQESTDIITVLDDAGKVKYESPAVARVLGYEPGELIGRNGFDLVHPDDVADISSTFAELVAEPGATVTAQARFRTADDEWRWLEVRGTNQLDHDAIEGVVTNNRDITVRKEREQELEETTTVLSTLVETLPVGVLVEDDSREIIAVNDRLFELFGLSGTPEEAVGTDCERLAREVSDMFVDPSGFRSRIDDLIETRTSVHEEELELRDGRVFTRSHEPIELLGGDGHLWVYREVTEQKTREERLRETRSRLEALFEQSPDMINIHDGDGNLIDPNPRLLEKTGYDEDELTDTRVWELDQTIAPDEARALWEGMDHGDRERFEGAYRRADDTTFPVEVHVRRLALDGDERFMAISRDITERKERERELERQNERLAEFASVVSHDLRNPLNVAAGRLELLEDECDSDQIEAIQRAHDRMETLIDDLLALARDGETESELVALGPLCENCWQNVETGTGTLRVETDRTICADRGRLTQLFENLVRNAVEHGGEDVTVVVGDLDDGFYVEDDGPGVPPEDRDRVFETGYSTAPDGTGFGLSIVRDVVEAHGWDLRLVEGDEGGARFEIRW